MRCKSLYVMLLSGFVVVNLSQKSSKVAEVLRRFLSVQKPERKLKLKRLSIAVSG